MEHAKNIAATKSESIHKSRRCVTISIITKIKPKYAANLFAPPSVGLSFMFNISFKNKANIEIGEEPFFRKSLILKSKAKKYNINTLELIKYIITKELTKKELNLDTLESTCSNVTGHE